MKHFVALILKSALHLLFSVHFLPVDAGALDLGPVLRLLRRGRLRLLLPGLPERGGVVLPPGGLEERDGHAHLQADAQETGDLIAHRVAMPHVSSPKLSDSYGTTLNTLFILDCPLFFTQN